jgi:hypothetical protein
MKRRRRGEEEEKKKKEEEEEKCMGVKSSKTRHKIPHMQWSYTDCPTSE